MERSPIPWARGLGTILLAAGVLVVLINTTHAGFIGIVLSLSGVGLRIEAALKDGGPRAN